MFLLEDVPYATIQYALSDLAKPNYGSRVIFFRDGDSTEATLSDLVDEINRRKVSWHYPDKI
jgi:hypothetical protein